MRLESQLLILLQRYEMPKGALCSIKVPVL